MNVKINDNLVETLIELGFDKEYSETYRQFENTTQILRDTWEDSKGTQYVTVGNRFNIPRSCCEITFKGKGLVQI